MPTRALTIAALLLPAAAAIAQPAPTFCPVGTHYTTIRHSIVQPGKWATFERAVTDHAAWYAGHNNATTTRIARFPVGNTPRLSETEAVTITTYSKDAAPAHDAGWAAFTAEYKASSTIKDEMRVCLPADAH